MGGKKNRKYTFTYKSAFAYNIPKTSICNMNNCIGLKKNRNTYNTYIWLDKTKTVTAQGSLLTYTCSK